MNPYITEPVCSLNCINKIIKVWIIKSTCMNVNMLTIKLQVSSKMCQFQKCCWTALYICIKQMYFLKKNKSYYLTLMFFFILKDITLSYSTYIRGICLVWFVVVCYQWDVIQHKISMNPCAYICQDSVTCTLTQFFFLLD